MFFYLSVNELACDPPPIVTDQNKVAKKIKKIKNVSKQVVITPEPLDKNDETAMQSTAQKSIKKRIVTHVDSVSFGITPTRPCKVIFCEWHSHEPYSTCTNGHRSYYWTVDF